MNFKILQNEKLAEYAASFQYSPAWRDLDLSPKKGTLTLKYKTMMYLTYKLNYSLIK